MNFGKGEIRKIVEFLNKYKKLKTKTEFEKFRCKVNNSIVTLYSTGKLMIQGNDAEKVKKRLLDELELGDELILGIDETGRGEHFGVFVVTGVLGYTRKLRELRDSKKIKGKALGDKAKIVMKNAVGVKTVSVSPAEIDFLRETGKNMNEIEASAINSIIEHFNKTKKKFSIIVDGARIKDVDKKANFVVGADDSVVQVGAASVIAKYEREKSRDGGRRKSWKSSKN